MLTPEDEKFLTEFESNWNSHPDFREIVSLARRLAGECDRLRVWILVQRELCEKLEQKDIVASLDAVLAGTGPTIADQLVSMRKECEKEADERDHLAAQLAQAQAEAGVAHRNIKSLTEEINASVSEAAAMRDALEEMRRDCRFEAFAYNTLAPDGRSYLKMMDAALSLPVAGQAAMKLPNPNDRAE